MPRLQVLNGKRQGATFEIGRGGAVIGHRNTAPISIDDPWVSWDHARVFMQGDAFWIEDLGSTNGTFVNCVRVKRERLNHEDIVFFGKTHVIFLVSELASGSADGAPATGPTDKKRSSFEVDLEAAAAAAKWAAPTSPLPAASPPRNGHGRMPSESAAPALPVGPGELAPAFPSPLSFEPGEESSRSRRDPFRPGADPWENRPGSPPNARGSALANLDPDADPFSSARAEPSAKGDDPFSVGQDPFDGPRARSFSETQHDRDEAPSSGARPTTDDGGGGGSKRQEGFQGFDIDEREPDPAPMTPVSAGEISSLLEAKRSSDGEEMDDLDALLGDAAARTPDPGAYRIPRNKPSEALTQPVDTKEARRLVEDSPRSPPGRPEPGGAAPGVLPGAGSSRFAGPPVAPVPPPRTTAALSATPGTQRPAPRLPEPGPGSASSAARTQALPAQNPVPPAQAARGPQDEARPIAAADLAFEVARLQDQVRRLGFALEAARQADPEKVRVAVEGLRAEELGRQAREIQDLRRELTALTEKHTRTQAELDDVTADMIDKEDTIDALKARIDSLGKPGRPSGPAGAADALSALEF